VSAWTKALSVVSNRSLSMNHRVPPTAMRHDGDAADDHRNELLLFWRSHDPTLQNPTAPMRPIEGSGALGKC
jgi:hypothetical protein